MSKQKDNVQNTIKAYKGLVPDEKLKPNYLKRPPVKFILFLYNEVVTKTGFGVGLIDEDLQSLSKSRTPLNKTQKMEFLTRLINFVGLCLRRPIPVYPSKIAAGKQVDKTNMLLQVFAKCARNKDGKYKHWENAVRMIQNGENPDMTGQAYEKAKLKKMEAKKLKEDAEKLRNKHQPPPQPDQEEEARKAEKLHEERLRKQKQEEIERLREVQRKQEMERKRAALEKKRRQEEEDRRRRLEEEAQKKHREEMLDQSDNQDEGGMDEGIDDQQQERGLGRGYEESIDPIRNHKGRPTSRKTMREIRHVGDGGIITRHVTESSEDIVNYEKTMTDIDPKVGGGYQEGEDVGGQGRYDYAEQPIPHPSQLGQGREEVEDDGEEDEIDDDDEESRKGDQHGSYVMVHDRQNRRNDQFNRNSQISQEDMALTKKLMNRGQDSQGSDKVQKTKEEEEEEDDSNRPRRKKIFFGRKSESGRRGRDSHASDLSYVRNGIQSVCESTNALGKSMDFIQEDLDSMKMELKKWRSMSFKFGNSLQNEKRKTDSELKEIRDKIFESNQAIENAVRKIHGAKAEILRNEQRIEDLLKNVVN